MYMSINLFHIDILMLQDVKLTDFCPETRLGKDLQQFATKYKREVCVNYAILIYKKYCYNDNNLQAVKVSGYADLKIVVELILQTISSTVFWTI